MNTHEAVFESLLYPKLCFFLHVHANHFNLSKMVTYIILTTFLFLFHSLHQQVFAQSTNSHMLKDLVCPFRYQEGFGLWFRQLDRTTQIILAHVYLSLF